MSDWLNLIASFPPTIWAGIAVSALAFVAALTLRESPIQQRINRLAQRQELSARREPLRDRFMRLASSLVPTLGLRASAADPDLKLRMRMAGFDTNAAVEIFVVSRLLLPIILFVVVWLYGRLIIGDGNGAIILLVASIAGIAGYLLPFLYLKNRIEKRRKAIQRAWPDALDLLVLTVEAGLPLDAALSRVASEIGKVAPILAHELKITIAEMLILPVRREAYENFASRTDLVMIRRVIDALIQVEEYGGEISSTLRVQARETRQLRISAAEQRAAALPPLLTVPMVVFLMPSLFAIILAPSLISVFGGE